MSTNDEVFIRSGPSQLTAVDWGNSDHRRIVMASLVQGVYVQQSDLVNGRQESQALAPSWWTSFHFTLKKVLYDQKDNSIFGAIYQLNPSAIAFKFPQFVVTFRGTQNDEDMKSNKDILYNKLFENTRFKQSIETVKKLITSSDGANTWLAGHSLGTAIAPLVGKEMTKKGFSLETYLFNPPFVSLSLERMKSRKAKQTIHFMITTIQATLAIGKSILGDLTADRNESEDSKRDPFADLKDWKPHLFLNSGDIFCSGYMGYFETREEMKKTKILRGLEKIATRDTIIRNLWTGEWHKEQEAHHLLASAELTVNKKWSSIIDAHEIQQWWNPEVDIKSKLYQY